MVPFAATTQALSAPFNPKLPFVFASTTGNKMRHGSCCSVVQNNKNNNKKEKQKVNVIIPSRVLACFGTVADNMQS
jgi:hypothetical protein